MTLILFLAALATAATNDLVEAVSGPLTLEIIQGLRDPFRISPNAEKKIIPKTELESFNLSDMKLTGVITGPKHKIAIVVTPNGKTYFVKRYERLGQNGGRVTTIRPDAIVIEEQGLNAIGKPEIERFELQVDGRLTPQSELTRDGRRG
jgi:Tfp pilus assembly protein PilP